MSLSFLFFVGVTKSVVKNAQKTRKNSTLVDNDEKMT